MSIQSEIDRINEAKAAIIASIAAKGIAVIDSEKLDKLAEKIALISTEDLDAVLTEQETLISQLQDTLQGKAAGGGTEVSGTIFIDQNGIHDVSSYAEAEVRVYPNTAPLQVTPTKETQFFEAFTKKVDGFEMVTVHPIPDEYIIPSGVKNITETGEYDVTEYASVKVEVPTGENVTAETNEYTAKLQALETAITALETELEGKAAGGGASVETYTGTVTGSTGLGDFPDQVYLYTDESMTIRVVALGRNESAEITIAAGTAIISSSEHNAITFTKDELINIFTESTGRVYFVLIPAADGFVF